MKIALVAHWDWTLYNFRMPLAQALRERGHDVIFVCPFGEYVSSIQKDGFPVADWHLQRRSFNPLSEGMAIAHLCQIYRRQALDAVHHFTIKPNIYGSLAAQMARIPKIINTFAFWRRLPGGRRRSIAAGSGLCFSRLTPIVVDDTNRLWPSLRPLCEHVGSLFDDVDRHDHHSDGTYPLAHHPVTSFSGSGPARFPLGLRLYRRDEALTQWEAAVAKQVPDRTIPREQKARNRLHNQVDPV